MALMLLLLLLLLCEYIEPAQLDTIPKIEIWNKFELQQDGPRENKTINPFEDYEFGANFSINSLSFHVYGFYDGNGIYKVRFMPNHIGIWNYITFSNDKTMNGIKGEFNCTEAAATNYGVAFVNSSRSNKSFTWSENNNAYFSVGTTSYSFLHYPDMKIINETLSTLNSLANNSTFNKLRFLVFPKWYRYTHIEPNYYPYISNGGLPQNTTNWNFRKFNVSFWQHLDYILDEILKMNNGNFIVDLILFHPYDYGHWGFDCMGGNNSSNYNISNDIFYLKYIIARIASYRNVWWSMANEFNLIKCKNYGLPNKFPIWDQYFETLIKYDPYDGKNGRIPQKEKSIHQSGNTLYNYTQPYVTHFSIQGFDDVNYQYFQHRFNVSKPVILDEVQYEGNLTNYPIDDLSATEETDRFWMANSNGNMCGHSEDMLPNSTDDGGKGTTILWNNFGKVLRGQSYGKIGWFYNYMINESIHPSFDSLTPICLLLDDNNTNAIPHCLISSLQKTNDYYLIHWSNFTQTSYTKKINLSLTGLYKLSYIDFMAESIKIVNQSLNGTNITIDPPLIPYNMELINIKSQYQTHKLSTH